jgi:hypothetical protein
MCCMNMNPFYVERVSSHTITHQDTIQQGYTRTPFPVCVCVRTYSCRVTYTNCDQLDRFNQSPEYLCCDTDYNTKFTHTVVHTDEYFHV